MSLSELKNIDFSKLNLHETKEAIQNEIETKTKISMTL